MKHKLGILAGLALALAVLSCQSVPPNSPGGHQAPGKPKVVVNYGNMRMDYHADLFVSLRFDDLFKKKPYKVSGTMRADIEVVRVTVTGPQLASPITASVNRSEFASGRASFSFYDLPPGPVSIFVEALDANGVVVATATGDATIVEGQVAEVTLWCTLAQTGLRINFECPDCPTTGPTATPTSTPTPTATPTPQPSSTPIVEPSPGTFEFGGNPLHAEGDAQGNVWITNATSNNVKKYSPSGQLIGTYTTGVRPYCVAFDPTGNVWVTNHDSWFITKLSPDGTLIGNYPLPAPNAYGVVADSAGNVWVSSYDSTVRKLSSDGQILETYNVGIYPEGMIIDGSGNIWVACTNSISRINPTTGTVDSFNIPGIHKWLTIDADQNIWTTNFSDSIQKVGSDGTLLATHVVGFQGAGIEIAPDGNLIVSDLTNYKVRRVSPTGAIVDTYSAGVFPSFLHVTPTGTIWCPNYRSGSVTIITP